MYIFDAGKRSADERLEAQITNIAEDLDQRIIGSYSNNPIRRIQLMICWNRKIRRAGEAIEGIYHADCAGAIRSASSP